MKSGLFEIVSLRVSQNSRDEPTLLGLDLVGPQPRLRDRPQGRRRPTSSTLDERLQKQFNVKLLGVWPFGPQVLFCKKPITKLADVKGLKVRTYDQNLAKFIESLGGTPVAARLRRRHTSRCRSAWSIARSPARAPPTPPDWPEVSTHQLPIGFQMALNGYAITLKSWNKLKPDQQAKLQAAFDAQIDDIWKYSEELFQRRGELQCRQGPVHDRQEVQPGQRAGARPPDIEIVRKRGARNFAADLGRGLRPDQPGLLATAGRRPSGQRLDRHQVS